MDDPSARPVEAAGNEIDRPVPSQPSARIWGSDAIAAMLRELDIPYVALNPGSSYRGLHDSIVNYLGNTRPRMLLCLHEESAVALAHGYAKVTGRPLAVIAHANVGLMHATMAIFNAWCDRVPMIVLGATGAVDAVRRRPWIEWIHTVRDQGALIRNYTKWDDQPSSIGAAQEALLRANMIAQTAPCGPVYINLNLELQEDEIAAAPPHPETARFAPPPPLEPAGPALRQAAELLARAERPVILMGRTSRDPEAWQRRVELAEAIGARVMTDRKAGAAFPTDHPLHAAGPATSLSPAGAELVAAADVILSLDWIDLAGTLKGACRGKAPAGKVIQVSVDQYVHNGWSMDYQGLPPADVYLLAEPDAAVPALLAEVKRLRPNAPPLPPARERRGAAALVGARNRLDHRGAVIGNGAEGGAGRRAGLDDPPAAQLGRASVGFPAPARLSRRRWRRRHRIGAGDGGRRGIGLARRRAPAGRGARRRRFPDGGHRAVDRSAQRHPAADRARQQPLVLQ